MSDIPLAKPMHIMITVSDPDRAIAFYTGALGFTVAFDRRDEQAHDAMLQLDDVRFRETFLVLGSMTICLIAFESPETLPASDSPSNRIGIHQVSFGVADIDSAAHRIVANGGKVLEETRYEVPQATMLAVTDPDGTRLGLVQRKS